MKRFLLALAAALLVVAPATAWANSITVNNSITNGGVGSVGYTYFTIDADDTVTIETVTDNFDATMYVFRNDGTFGLVGLDDDSGSASAFGGFNALLEDTFAAGDYIVAVSDFFLSEEEALSGINSQLDQEGTGFGAYELTITPHSASTNINLTPVPEPASMILLGTGLAAAMGARHRKKKAQKRSLA